ncbi:MAG: hypothetical protein GYB68_06615 [Chloroflexi bacterium]|nr:hypothetical protein [Chloroflexota bacterium]
MKDDDPARASQPEHTPLIAIVGPCASGKTTLASALRDQGYNARAIAQEHSNIRDLWQKFSHADVLVYLDVSLEGTRERRPAGRFDQERLAIQTKRLGHARQHSDLYIHTDHLRREDVLDYVLAYLGDQQAS